MKNDTAREAEQLRRRRARLADPNTSPLQRMIDEAYLRGPPPWWELGEPPPPKPTQTHKRKPSVASVIHQMQKAGVDVAGCEINPRDGTVIVRTGKPVGDTDMDDATPIDRSEWN